MWLLAFNLSPFFLLTKKTFLILQTISSWSQWERRIDLCHTAPHATWVKNDCSALTDLQWEHTNLQSDSENYVCYVQIWCQTAVRGWQGSNGRTDLGATSQSEGVIQKSKINWKKFAHDFNPSASEVGSIFSISIMIVIGISSWHIWLNGSLR